MKCPRCQQETPSNARNGELATALEQQTATSEILRVISSSPTDVQPVFDTIARNTARLCGDGSWCIVTRYDGELVHLVAQHNARGDAADMERLFPIPLSEPSTQTRAISERSVVHIPDVEQDEAIRERARGVRSRSLLTAPLLRDGKPIGSISASKAAPGAFSDAQIALLQTFADQAVIAIENVRRFKELQGKNADLTEALERQTATAESLRVISASPTDVQPVFETIAARAMRLCEATDRIGTASVHRGGWPRGVWAALSRSLSSFGDLCGKDSEGRATRRPARRAGHEIRARDQPQDGEGPRPHDPAVAAGTGGPGDRVTHELTASPGSSMTREPFGTPHCCL
jgi:hypothetical protein